MKTWEIRSLRVGELHIPHGPGLLRDPIHCWLIDDGETRILVDTGMPDAEDVYRKLRVGGIGGGHAGLVAALGEWDLTPQDIGFIIATHLHYDHGFNLDLFPDACVILQRDELFHAVDPAPTQRILYRRETVVDLVSRKRPSRLRLIDGDHAFMDGIHILKLPSHTPGMQVPIVSTAKGKVALVSDLGDHYKVWFPADPRATAEPQRYLADTFVPSPYRTSGEREYVAAMQRAFDHADIVVPAHDFRIPKHMPHDWWAVPDSTAGDLQHGPLPGANTQ
jgi:glyoxylase-like metal-dependent hydrolase (beta-lactamase superfamily II)